jgi:ABC-type uncharacterized transport system involved in gliding motility auxiliary subunit
MNRISKVLLICSGIALLVAGVLSLAGLPLKSYSWIPLSFAALFYILEVVVDRKLYFQFLGMRTTKHGMNMGVMILLVIGILIGLNFIAIRQNKKWDFTAEKINSLSDQTVKLLKGLDEDLEVIGFFKEESREEEQAKMGLRQVVDMLDDESPRVKYQTVDPIKEPALTKELNVTDTPAIVVRYKGKSANIFQLTEEALANAIIKVSRTKNKVVYHLVGHGEMNFEDAKEGAGGAQLKNALQDSSYDVRPLNMMAKAEVPMDAEVLLILGSRQPLFEPELNAIEAYAKRGGSLLVTADPGTAQNLSILLKKLGVIFDNNYIIDQAGQMIGSSAIVAVGLQYSPNSEITKKFTPDNFTAFELASSLAKDAKAPADFRYEDLVFSSPYSFSKNQLTKEVKMDPKTDKKGPLLLGLSVTGSLPGAEAGKKFNLIAFGDTDFAANRLIAAVPTNRDLILNSISFLAKDEDLVSIKPKQLEFKIRSLFVGS